MSQLAFFPTSSQHDLRAAFVGQSLRDVPVPSAVLDIAKVKSNCKLMLDAVADLKLAFRAHVKTHKTNELTRLQVGEESKDVRLVVSTVIEAESLVPLMKDYQKRGAKVNILYGIPLGSSMVSRLAAVGRELGPGSVAAMIDHPMQLASVRQFKQEAGNPMSVFIKTDSGYHRAGLPPTSDSMAELLKLIDQAESQGDLHLLGFYSHNSLSYGGNVPEDAMAMLKLEFEVCKQAASHLKHTTARSDPLVFSVGSSPTALSIQNITSSSSSSSSPESSTTTTAHALQQTLTQLSQSASNFALEIHAGVYPVFDLQQVAASSRSFPSDLAAHQTQALTVLTEVLSTYPTRTSSPEALVAAGTLALGKESCKSYPGWGVLTAWPRREQPDGTDTASYGEDDSVRADGRVIVKRVAQEHGIIGWEDASRTDDLPVRVGDRVRLWINHACIAAAGFGWYLVVDSSKGDGDVVEDVWVRWRGW